MNDRVLFSSMSPAAKQFYHRIFNTVVLNAHAVRTGLFDTLLCETEDPRIIGRWRAAVPGVIDAIQKRNQKRLEEGDPPSTST